MILICETTAGFVLSVLPQAIVLETCRRIAFRAPLAVSAMMAAKTEVSRTPEAVDSAYR